MYKRKKFLLEHEAEAVTEPPEALTRPLEEAFSKVPLKLMQLILHLQKYRIL